MTDINQKDIVKQIYQAFSTPQRYTANPFEQAVLDRGRHSRVRISSGELAVSTWGSGDSTVLLMHGWGGARAQVAGMIDPLLAAGYSVIAFDQPAHGESDGTMTNAFEMAAAMAELAL